MQAEAKLEPICATLYLIHYWPPVTRQLITIATGRLCGPLRGIVFPDGDWLGKLQRCHSEGLFEPVAGSFFGILRCFATILRLVPSFWLICTSKDCDRCIAVLTANVAG